MVTRLGGRTGLLLALILASGCAAGGTMGTATQPKTEKAAKRTPLAEDAPSSHRPAAPAKPVTVAFGGDVHFEDEIAVRLQEDPQTTLGPVSAVLRSADVSMVNLESAISSGGSAAAKTYTFRAPPAALRALDAAGVDVATMANNHGMDYGLAGLRDSLSAARQNDFPLVGIGRNAAQAYAPWIVEVNGQRLAFLGATQVIDTAFIDEWTAGPGKPGLASAKKVDRLAAAVRAVRPKVDTVVVYLHWGQSLEPCPLPRQRHLARTLIDAGADVLVGTHAHRLLAGGSLRGAYVHYGLGNFVWYNPDPPGGDTGVLTLTVRGRKVSEATWTPAVISGGIPHILSGSEARQERAEWRGLRDCTDLSPGP